MANNYTISSYKLLTVSHMISKTQIHFLLHELEYYKLVAYKSNLGNGKHLVTLHNVGFAAANLSSDVVNLDYVVTEEQGYLSAVSKCGRLSIARLS